MSATEPKSPDTADSSAPAIVRDGRDKHVDTLRGGAVLLLIAYHSISTPMLQKQGGRVAHQAIDSFIMPLYAMLSGYVYAMRPVVWDKARKFVRNKIVRLLMPMAIASLVMLGLQWYSAHQIGSWRSVRDVLFYSYEHFWFLQALFLVFLIIVLIDCMKWLGKPYQLLIWLIVGLALRMITDPILERYPEYRDLFSIWAVGYLLVPFLVGLGITRFPGILRSKQMMVAMIVIGIATCGLYIYAYNHPEAHINSGRMGLVGMTLGIAISYLLILSQLNERLLAWLGNVSYPIYLYHVIGIAIGARIARKAFPNSMLADFGVHFTFGLLFPLILIALLSIWPFAYGIMTGEVIRRPAKS